MFFYSLFYSLFFYFYFYFHFCCLLTFFWYIYETTRLLHSILVLILFVQYSLVRIGPIGGLVICIPFLAAAFVLLLLSSFIFVSRFYILYFCLAFVFLLNNFDPSLAWHCCYCTGRTIRMACHETRVKTVITSCQILNRCLRWLVYCLSPASILANSYHSTCSNSIATGLSHA